MAPPNKIDDLLAKSCIGPDVYEAVAALRAGEDHPLVRNGLIEVIVECNALFPGGAVTARNFLIAHFLRSSDRGSAGSLHPGLDNPDPEDIVSQLVRRVALSPVGREGSSADVVSDWLATADLDWAQSDVVAVGKSRLTDKYLFAALTRRTLDKLSKLQLPIPGAEAIKPLYRISGNHPCGFEVYESGRTVKCDAARAAFGASGKGIVWAVADSGIDGGHPHFRQHRNLELPEGLAHLDLTGEDAPLVDALGHGTHVAGIIAGETCRDAGQADCTVTLKERRKAFGQDDLGEPTDAPVDRICGVAPQCSLLSLKVVPKNGNARSDDLIAAINYVRQANSGGYMRIHGMNISLGYRFDPEWFAAGHSPLCKEVDRLVAEGVVVVVAAGNGGYGTVLKLNQQIERATHLGTIHDPGNAERAITVGSAHRDSPHTFGVSFFSGKGPTADGRQKPDLVAPGERIVSAEPHDPSSPDIATYRERSGTSMAAPHVSGCIAAFLSVRGEFVGQPDRVKSIFQRTATDIGRRPDFQGAGLVDVMRALQDV